MAVERQRLEEAGLPAGAIRTIQSARKPSTIRTYEPKWQAFSKWCEGKTDPTIAPMELVLTYLQILVDRQLAYDTVRSYGNAITAFHRGFPGGVTVMTHHWGRSFFRGLLRSRPATRRSAPAWDLPLVLNALCEAPFEPLEQADIAHLSKKTAFLIAITSGKRVSDMIALSTQPGCLVLTGDKSKAVLRPNPTLHPKMVRKGRKVSNLTLEAFYPNPVGPEAVRLHGLCPVRALDEYLRRTEGVRTTDQLFVAYGGASPGKALTKARLAHWMVDVICEAYERAGLPTPSVKAHSTRGTATSMALLRGVTVEEICDSADWRSENVFISHYLRDVRNGMASAVLSAAEERPGTSAQGQASD